MSARRPVVTIGSVRLRFDDGPRDPPREALFAVAVRSGRPAPLPRRPSTGLGDGCALARIHAHVQRPVRSETEPALRGIELPRRDAEVGEQTVDGGDAALVEPGRQLADSRRVSARRDRRNGASDSAAHRQRRRDRGRTRAPCPRPLRGARACGRQSRPCNPRRAPAPYGGAAARGAGAPRPPSPARAEASCCSPARQIPASDSTLRSSSVSF